MKNILLFAVKVPSDIDQSEFRNDFQQKYESELKLIKNQHQEQIKEREKQLGVYEQQINRLIDELGKSVSKSTKTYHISDFQFAGGLIDTETLNARHIGGNIHNDSVVILVIMWGLAIIIIFGTFKILLLPAAILVLSYGLFKLLSA